MTDLTGKKIANTYKDLLQVNSSASNDGLDGTLRRVQDGSGKNSALELSQNAAKINGNLTVLGNVSATSFAIDGLTVSAINAVDISATNIIVGGDNVATSAGLATVSATMATSIANVSAALESRIVGVSSTFATTSATLETHINLVSANLVSTSAALESHINTVSATLSSTNAALQTSIANVSVNLETRIAGVSATFAGTSATLESRIATVSNTMATSIAAVSAALESRINTVSATMATSIANVSAALETRIATVSSTLESHVALLSSTMATSISNSNTAITALSATMATSIGNSNAAVATLSATMATSIGNQMPKAGGTFTGAITLSGDPGADLQAATKQYVDNLVAAGIHYHESVRLEQPGAVSATYNNGTAGVGATLTNAGTQGILIVDGVTAVNDDRILIYEQADQTHNGVYVVTTVGSPSTNWVLTRSTDTDSHGMNDASTLDEGSYFFVEEGNTGAGESYICNTVGTITFGTTNITFVQFSSQIQYTAGTGIAIGGDRVISTSGVPTDAELAAVSATMATSIANVSATLESRIATVSSTMATSIANVSTALETRIANVSSTLETRIANVSTTFANTSSTLETRINSVSVLTETKASAATSVNLETRINAVSVIAAAPDPAAVAFAIALG